MDRVWYSIDCFFPEEWGAAKFVRVLAREIASGGGVPSVLTLQLDPSWRRRDVIDGIRVHRIPVLRVGEENRMGRIGKWFHAMWLSAFILRNSREYGLFHG